MKDRIQKMKDWMADHPDVVIAGTVITFYAALAACAIHIDRKQREADAENWTRVTDAAMDRNKIILPNRDGSFWILDREAS